MGPRRAAADRGGRRIDIVVPPYMGAADRLGALDGVDAASCSRSRSATTTSPDALPPGHVFANAASVHETSTAELTLRLVLAAQRGIPDFVRAAAEGRWAPARHESLADRRVLLARLRRRRPARSRSGSRRSRSSSPASRAAPATTSTGASTASTSCRELLPDAEIVIVGVPLNEATTGLVDAAFLAALPDGALLVNIARGNVADTDAILAEAAVGPAALRPRRHRSRAAARRASALRPAERARSRRTSAARRPR